MATQSRISFQPPLHEDDSDDDDFPIPLSQTPKPTTSLCNTTKPLQPSINLRRPNKPEKPPTYPGKENVDPNFITNQKMEFKLDKNCSLDLIQSTIDCTLRVENSHFRESVSGKESKMRNGYSCNSIEARLMRSRSDFEVGPDLGGSNEDDGFGDLEDGTELDVLIRLCDEDNKDVSVECPLCGIDISDLSEESRMLHTNDCLDKDENHVQDVVIDCNKGKCKFQPQVVEGPGVSSRKVDVSPVLNWLQKLGLERYEEAFAREEIDWDSLQWLTEEDLFSIGVTALGPRKKILHGLGELRKGRHQAGDIHSGPHSSKEIGSLSTHQVEIQEDGSEVIGHEISKPTTNKLITDYFPGSTNVSKKVCTSSRKQQGDKIHDQDSVHKCAAKTPLKNRKSKNIPLWCSIPGTPFRVDAFKYLRGDCSHWFLTHFHVDHYQGLTRSFCHGKIYCSLITAKLVNMKIGISWDRLEVLPLNQQISIAGIHVTCLDANHCPGSIIILFEPLNGKAVLHTGDFRFCEKMASATVLQTRPIHTLILDTTYCNPQYDFPAQEAVIQFVIEAIQAESFNPQTLFLIGSYAIGKERLFLEVARVLRRKVHVTLEKLRLLECLGFSEEDMQWFTVNQQESHIHVVPMWMLASFKRLKHISSQYAGRFSLIVAFSPTGWTFGKGKKKTPGRRWQQGTIIRYEVPYSEHSSFTELKEFVEFVSPENIIPSVNNDGPDSANSMVSLLLS